MKTQPMQKIQSKISVQSGPHMDWANALKRAEEEGKGKVTVRVWKLGKMQWVLCTVAWSVGILNSPEFWMSKCAYYGVSMSSGSHKFEFLKRRSSVGQNTHSDKCMNSPCLHAQGCTLKQLKMTSCNQNYCSKSFMERTNSDRKNWIRIDFPDVVTETCEL